MRLGGGFCPSVCPLPIHQLRTNLTSPPLLVPAAANIPQCLLNMVAPGANLTVANLTIANSTTVNITVGNATAANATDPTVTASGLTDTPTGEPACTCSAHSSVVGCPLTYTAPDPCC